MERAVLSEAGVELPEAGVRISSRPAPADARTVRTLRERMRGSGARTAVDAVHAHGLRAGALAALARGPRGLGPRLVVTLHNRVVGPRTVRAMGRLLLRVIRSRADAVLTVSPDLDPLVHGVPEVEHAIIPAGPGSGATAVSGATAAASARPARDAPDLLEVLVVARLAPQKGLDVLLDALGLLVGEAAPAAPGLRVRIAGDGPLEPHLRARIRAERLPVELLGRREDVPDLLADCDLVVSSALWEGQPVFLQEALRAGRAIVATDAGGTRLVTGGAALLVPVGDPAALARAITSLRRTEARETAELASRECSRELSGPDDLLAQLTQVLRISLP
ncbi:glycosyltransferase family 4 protein [Brachybacterium sp. MASK1Z-5]|uniref:Glycosyltransferase family 4 protein n=2 Tax=Brachybacterium halotolerans TaxID=2795215 RepID=A0ABS1B594_9MICO|nr:glycosyltransferase family 4 protein [Brachybacterium halotolerans]MBK0329803.1 glycosyltransferase family 4 protein [Brachybacterium halotolerans]